MSQSFIKRSLVQASKIYLLISLTINTICESISHFSLLLSSQNVQHYHGWASSAICHTRQKCKMLNRVIKLTDLAIATSVVWHRVSCFTRLFTVSHSWQNMWSYYDQHQQNDLTLRSIACRHVYSKHRCFQMTMAGIPNWHKNVTCH